MSAEHDSGLPGAACVGLSAHAVGCVGGVWGCCRLSGWPASSQSSTGGSQRMQRLVVWWVLIAWGLGGVCVQVW